MALDAPAAGPGPTAVIWVVDAFTSDLFGGNPAAVVVLDTPAPEGWMRAVAAEMRHSETAFLRPADDGWSLRWFTPEREVDLCGHATLASAHVLWTTGRAQGPLAFDTRSGTLHCTQASGRIAMRFPAAPARRLPPAEAPAGLFDALGIPPTEVHAAANGNLLLPLPDAAVLRAVAPDFRALRAVSDRHGYILTAPFDEDASDVACRYFVPAWGIDEDPATGSIQCTLGPYWQERLGKDQLVVRQLSERGATMQVRPMGDVVEVSGQAVTVLAGTLASY